MEQIYFTDNFFLLRNRIRVLQELLELEINGDIFNIQIMEEMRNIARLLGEHERLLNERNQLQGFAELAHQLFRVKHAFLQFLRSAMYSQKVFLRELLQKNNDEWHKVIIQISDGNEKLAEEFRNCNQENHDNNAMVSDAELELLFQSDWELELDKE
ncbi:hypothetical protein P0082_06365 [Candidatus Haliotispira prima]|uniref:Uncharacterized protein n=1 Tax=Candidatus Haliotispira prima TaxID=3034016 RepID=A0ABY8MDQ1_9SPIO|nr:hypothetical protein P0082_06365 [Candidatus Haliotispira prima]